MDLTKRLRYVAKFTLSTMGMFLLFLILCFFMGEHDTLTRYESLMTIIASVSLSSHLFRRDSDND